jgi:hypothetical protein
MLTSRMLKQDPPLDEKTLFSLLERGPIGRKEMFAHFKATFPDGEPNADGIRGTYLDECLGRFIARELIGVDRDGVYRLTAGVEITEKTVYAAIETDVATTIDHLRLRFLAGRGRTREIHLEQVLGKLEKGKKLTCTRVTETVQNVEREVSRTYAIRPTEQIAPTDMAVDAAFLPVEAQMPTLASAS